MPRTLSLTLLAIALAAVEPSSPTIIVTAERRESELLRAPLSVEFVDRQTIDERGGAINATDWLRDLSGVGLWNSGGGVDGGTVSVRLRGLNGRFTLFLVDGIPVEDQSNISGEGRLPLFQPAGLDHVEVLKGSQSGLYGSGAIGGVVDFRTVRPTATPRERVQATGGSFGSLGGEVVATGPIGGSAGYAVALNGLSSEGFSSQTGSPDGDPQGYENDAVQRCAGRARFEQRAGGATFYASAATSRTRQDYDGTGPDDGDSHNSYRQWQMSGGASVREGSAYDASVDVSYQRALNENTFSTSDPSRYQSASWYGAARGSRAVTEHVRLSGGVDGRRDEALTQYGPGLDPVFDTGVNQVGVFAQAGWSDQRIEATATGRLDHHQTFGDEPTGRLAMAWFAVPDALKVRGAVGTGFRAPSLYQLYHVEPGYSVGNPDLDPERSISYEGGVDWNLSRSVALAATVFSTEVEDEIVFGYAPPRTYHNDQGSSVARGVEAGGVAEEALSQSVFLKVEANYTYLDSTDGSGDTAAFAPQHQGGGRLTMSEDTGTYWKTWQTVGVRRSTAYYSNISEQDRVDGETVADAALGLGIGEHWEATFRIDNLFNERYVVNSSFGTAYATAPRSYWLTVTGKF